MIELFVCAGVWLFFGVWSAALVSWWENEPLGWVYLVILACGPVGLVIQVVDELGRRQATADGWQANARAANARTDEWRAKAESLATWKETVTAAVTGDRK